MVRYHQSLLFFAAATALSSSLIPQVQVQAQTDSSAASSCDLDCGDNVCVFGSATFADHAQQYDGSDFDFHADKDVNNMHCDCPHGWTGVLCDTIFKSCSGNHKCYHGGECIDGLIDSFGNEQLFCDCENAFDDEGYMYEGKYCEDKGINFCADSDDHFCLHEGECSPDYPVSGDPCICSGGYEGAHCQFQKGTVPDCDLSCGDNGTCILGSKSSAEMKEHYQFWDEADNAPDQHMYCQCSAGFDGTLCEVTKMPCGDDHCFHGGTCIVREVDGHQVHHCDCSTADTGSDSYAGRLCQYVAEEYCTKDVGFNGQLFCVNGGECNDDDPYQGCQCGVGFAGFSCEFVMSDFDAGNNQTVDEVDAADLEDPQADDGITIVDYDAGVDVCDLDCKNEGTCRNGKKELGYLSDIANLASHLNETHTEDFQHCVCPKGFVGLLCEHKVILCPESEHLCLHGASCTTNGDDRSCDCSSTVSEIANVFAGEHCEHPATQVCTIGQPGPSKPLSFCVNFGTCMKNVTSDQAHPGCFCENGWEGPHCEIKISRDAVASSGTPFSPSSSNNNNDDSNNAARVFMTTALVLAVAVLSLVLATVLIRNRKRRNNAASNGMHWGSSYRDSPERNISPRRESIYKNKDSESVYPPSSHSSSRDPMATHLAPTSPSQIRQKDPEIYIGPPRDEDGHELHSVEIV